MEEDIKAAEGRPSKRSKKEEREEEMYGEEDPMADDWGGGFEEENYPSGAGLESIRQEEQERRGVYEGQVGCWRAERNHAGSSLTGFHKVACRCLCSTRI